MDNKKEGRKEGRRNKGRKEGRKEKGRKEGRVYLSIGTQRKVLSVKVHNKTTINMRKRKVGSDRYRGLGTLDSIVDTTGKARDPRTYGGAVESLRPDGNPPLTGGTDTTVY